MAAYLALLQPGDTVMGMTLSHGGHLTHGAPVNFSGRYYEFISYGINQETELIDYEEIERLARKHRPKIIVAGASSYPRVIEFERFKNIAGEVGARLLVDMAHIVGLIVAGLHPSPISCADIVTSSTHKTLRGPRSGFIICKDELASRIDAAVFPMMQGGPLMHAIAAKAIAFQEAMQPEFNAYQKQIVDNAATLAQELRGRGFRLVTGGTDNHLVLVDLTDTGITGRDAQMALEEAGILVNRNSIPFDSRPPQITSGIRVGTPAVTTRGMATGEMEQIASHIDRVLSNHGDKSVINEVRDQVLSMCLRYPAPGID
jgi:glycine hydroxymethyltransferase